MSSKSAAIPLSSVISSTELKLLINTDTGMDLYTVAILNNKMTFLLLKFMYK